MSDNSSSLSLSELKLPFRDALRGANVAADVAQEALSPVVALLPETVRSQLPDASALARPAGRLYAFSHPNAETLMQAALFVTTPQTGRRALRSCAKIFVFAWDELNAAGPLRRHLVSETIIVSRLNDTDRRTREQGVGRAAKLLDDLRQSKAIGRMPGMARATSRDEQLEVDLRLLSIMVWLLAPRAPSMREELDLLNLSLVWVRAFEEDAGRAFDATSNLADFLARTSERL